MTRSTKSGVKLPIQVGHAVYAITANPSSFVGAWQVVSSSREQPHWTTLLARAPRRECDSDCASSGDGHCQVDPAASAGYATDRSPRFVPDNSHVPSRTVSQRIRALECELLHGVSRTVIGGRKGPSDATRSGRVREWVCIISKIPFTVLR